MIPGFAKAETATDRALVKTAELILDTAEMRKHVNADHKVHGNAFTEANGHLSAAAASIAVARDHLAKAHAAVTDIYENVCDPVIIVQGGGGGGK